MDEDRVASELFGVESSDLLVNAVDLGGAVDPEDEVNPTASAAKSCRLRLSGSPVLPKSLTSLQTWLSRRCTAMKWLVVDGPKGCCCWRTPQCSTRYVTFTSMET